MFILPQVDMNQSNRSIGRAGFLLYTNLKSDFFTLYNPTRNLRYSNSIQLVVPQTRLNRYGDRAFMKAAPVLWNSLPLDVKCAKTLDSFKIVLKTHLYREHFKTA